jgi:hypothetical protein
MTQILTSQQPSIQVGPRGIGARSAGGGYSQDAQQDIQDCDCFQGPITLLSGTTDALTPPSGLGGPGSGPGVGAPTLNYVIKTGQIDAITAVAPRAGIDDGMTMSVYSDTAFVHTITFSTNCIADGTAGAPHHIVTFTNGTRGAGVVFRAFNGTWQVIGATGVAFT